MTKHLLVTDHYHTREQLAQIAKRISSGQGITFDPGTLKEAWVNADDIRRQNRRMTIGCAGFLVVVILVAVALIIFYLIP